MTTALHEAAKMALEQALEEAFIDGFNAVCSYNDTRLNEPSVEWKEHNDRYAYVKRAIKALGGKEDALAQQEPCKNCHGEGIDGEDSDGINSAVTWACAECNGTGIAPQAQQARSC